MTKSGLNWICPMTLFFINLVCNHDQVVEIFTNFPISPRSSNLESRVKKKMTKILKHQYMRKIIIFIDDPLGIYVSLVQCFLQNLVEHLTTIQQVQNTEKKVCWNYTDREWSCVQRFWVSKPSSDQKWCKKNTFGWSLVNLVVRTLASLLLISNVNDPYELCTEQQWLFVKGMRKPLGGEAQ